MRRTISAMIRPADLGRLTFIFALVVAATPAFAQREAHGLSQPGSGSAGGSVFWDLSGDKERLGSKDGSVGPLWLVYGMVFVTPRIAIGAESSTLGTRETSISNPIIGNYRYVSKSTSFYGVARMRVVRRQSISVDALGGVGGQFGHQEFYVTPPAGASQAPSNTNDSVKHLSYLVGAEMPMAVARHFDMSPFVRMYFLRGSPHQPTDSPGWYTGIGTGMTVAFKW